MNIYLISRTTDRDYDEYDSAVVAAENEEDARTIQPDGSDTPTTEERYSSWVAISQVKVELIGMAKPFTKRGVICASFNAG